MLFDFSKILNSFYIKTAQSFSTRLIGIFHRSPISTRKNVIPNLVDPMLMSLTNSRSNGLNLQKRRKTIILINSLKIQIILKTFLVKLHKSTNNMGKRLFRQIAWISKLCGTTIFWIKLLTSQNDKGERIFLFLRLWRGGGGVVWGGRQILQIKQANDFWVKLL